MTNDSSAHARRGLVRGLGGLAIAGTLALAGCTGEPIDAAPETPAAAAASKGLTDLEAQRNYDARIEFNKANPAVTTSVTELSLANRFPGLDLSVSFDDTTGATRTLSARVGYLTSASKGDALDIALSFVDDHVADLGITDADLAGMELTDRVFSKVTGATHLYFRQTHQGLPVYNAQLHLNVNRDGKVLSVNNAFVPQLASAAGLASPGIDAAQAAAGAAEHLGITLSAAPTVAAQTFDTAQTTVVEAPELSVEPIEAKLMWLPIQAGNVALVWNFQVHTLDRNHDFDMTVDANSGQVWTRFDWVAADSYRVFAQPVESPSHAIPPTPADGRTVEVNPADAVASPLGWHDTGSSTFTVPRGNNVHAYEDSDGNGSPPGTQPDCGPSLNCDFPLDFTQEPGTYQDAAIANLFYWNNIVHDVQYQYGFDEVGGNFQVNNFGNGGSGNDDVRAEGQDGGGTNNANMSTPPDGSRPRMQMFLWTLTDPGRDGDFDNGIIIHEYGHGISIRQVGGPSNSGCLNNAQQGGEGWSDFWSLTYTAEVGDQGTDVRGIGTYALGEPTSGPGIRTQPYSTDPSVNDHTYESIQGKAIPHGVGEVWAQGIWEVYWALVDEHGFDPDLYDALGGAGNQRAMLYVNEGFKNTACSPTFLDARDGIIQAATDNFGGEDVCLLWETFAAYGMGTDAVSGGSNSTSPTNGFEIPVECQCAPQPIADAGADQILCLGESATIGSAARPGTTYTWSPGGQSGSEITVAPTQTTTFTVTATNACGSATDSVRVTVDDGTAAEFFDSFDGDVSAWDATGLWHQTFDSTCTAPEPGHTSPTGAFYYGQDGTCDYATGGATSGSLTSPLIAGINDASILSFNFYREVESFSGDFDVTSVDIVTEDGTATTVFRRTSRNTSANTWLSSPEISLGQFSGQNIRVRFTFDSGDGSFNTFVGWLIDDLRVTTASQCSPGDATPLVTIDGPADGSTFNQGQSIDFDATATDLEDGDVSASVSWSSDVDGALGTGAAISATLSVGTHVVTATATDSGGQSGQASITVTVVPSAGGFFDDFEGDVSGWTTSGLWHRAANSACTAPEAGSTSPVSAFYYGRDATCTYATGSRTTGDLVSPVISGLNANTVLSFNFYRQVESFNGDFDRVQVQILTNGGVTATTVFSRNSSNASAATWTSSGNIALGQFAGQDVQVRFRFDSVDGVSNGFTGWLIDDVSVQ
ncbi:M36 family metallopeptidase [Haliangium sp.]|uniref:M36 family metallopeptidase n=1 Tax=Haliangium sp. TaxID=2663208 RepID=UPI003D148481